MLQATEKQSNRTKNLENRSRVGDSTTGINAKG